MKSNLKHQLQWLFSFSHYKQWHMNIRYMHNWECIEFDFFKNFIWNNTWSFSYYFITNDNLRSEASHVLQVRSFTFDSKRTKNTFVIYIKNFFLFGNLFVGKFYMPEVKQNFIQKCENEELMKQSLMFFFEYYINIPGQGIILKQDQKSTRCDY